MGGICGSGKSKKAKKSSKPEAGAENPRNTRHSEQGQNRKKDFKNEGGQGINSNEPNLGLGRSSVNRNNQSGVSPDLTSRRDVINLNNMNISINDEFPERNQSRANVHHRISSARYFCSRCNCFFQTEADYGSHVNLCENTMMGDPIMSSGRLNNIYNLVQSLNRQLTLDSRIISLIGKEEPEENYDYINWRYNKEKSIWENKGKLRLEKDEMRRIEAKSNEDISTEPYYMKRIWLMNYVEKKLYDKEDVNTTLVVSRKYILEESFNQFMTTMELDLKKAVHFFFIDEVALDVGGVYREWYSGIFDVIFSEEENFFCEVDNRSEGKNTFFIPLTSPKRHGDYQLDYYEFIGKIVGKAIFDKITLKTYLNPVIIKHLLMKEVTLEDLRYIDLAYYESLKAIMNNRVDKALGFTFTWNVRRDTGLEEVELVDGGKEILVDNDNKQVFVSEVVSLLTYKLIKEKLESFLKGFYSLIPHQIIKIMSVEEFGFLLSGQSRIDISDWKANTIYKGIYNESHPTVESFWHVLETLPAEDLLLFFKFCTGSNRVPIDGFATLQGPRNQYRKFCIEGPELNESQKEGRLIEAKTCFNRITLPNNPSQDEIKKVIYTILQNDTNFFGKQ